MKYTGIIFCLLLSWYSGLRAENSSAAQQPSAQSEATAASLHKSAKDSSTTEFVANDHAANPDTPAVDAGAVYPLDEHQHNNYNTYDNSWMMYAGVSMAALLIVVVIIRRFWK